MFDDAKSARKRLLLGLFTAVLIGCVLSFPIPQAGGQTETKSGSRGRFKTNLPQQSKKIQAHLYFADRNNSFLKSEQRVMRQPDDPVAFGRAIVEALINGPQKGLVRTIPVGTGLSAIFIDSEKVCYIDLSSAVKENHPGGSNSEMLTIYSIVNSLILNVSEIKQVKVLIDGNEAPTLAGHISLQDPFRAHMLLIR
jgi:spore germination protein GerM